MTKNVKTTLESFGEIIKALREEKNVPLRKVAAFLDIDQAILSKYEHNTRLPKREQVVQLAQYFKTNEKQLLIKWLAQKVIYEVEDEDLALEAMKAAEEQIMYQTNRKNK